MVCKHAMWWDLWLKLKKPNGLSRPFVRSWLMYLTVCAIVVDWQIVMSISSFTIWLYKKNILVARELYFDHPLLFVYFFWWKVCFDSAWSFFYITSSKFEAVFFCMVMGSWLVCYSIEGGLKRKQLRFIW